MKHNRIFSQGRDVYVDLYQCRLYQNKKIDILTGEMRVLDRDDEAHTTASNSILKSPKKYEVIQFT